MAFPIPAILSALRNSALAFAALVVLPASAQMVTLPAAPPGSAVATFAGGCFWCMEPPFDKLPGVIATTSGYTGGTKAKPTYEEVSSGGTGHTEAVQVVYDPEEGAPTRSCSTSSGTTSIRRSRTGSSATSEAQYRTAIFVHTDDQRRAAEASKAALDKAKPFKEPIVTPIVAATEFCPAEEYHQDYYKKNPVRYTYYRTGCGRDARLKQLWGSAAPH